MKKHTVKLFHAALMVIPILSGILAPLPVLSAQGMVPTVPGTRYIDRNKGEYNRAVPIDWVDYSQATDHESGHPLLWRIQRDGLMSSYIFGTIHIDDSRVMNLPESVTTRLQTADRLMLELKLDQRTAIDSMRRMIYTDGRNLQQAIGEELYDEVNLAFSETGKLPAQVISILKPWAAMLILLRPDNASGTFLDKHLGELASNAGIDVLGLESIDEQLSAFDQLSLDDQTELLEQALTQLDDKDDNYQRLLGAWLDGDLASLVEISDSLQPDDTRLTRLLNEKLITARNQTMLLRMQHSLQQGNSFIAVGALHLPGEDGLLELLRQQGYRVNRVPATGYN